MDTLAKLMSKNDLTSIFLGPGHGEEQEDKFLGHSICWRSYGLTWARDVKLVNEALQEWDMSTSNGLETPGMIDYDVSSHEIAEFMSKEEAAKYHMIAFASKEASRSMSSPKQGEEIKIEKNTEILAEATDNNVSIRMAGSSRRVDRVYRERLGWLQAHPEIHQWGCHYARFASSTPLFTDSSWWPSRELR